MIKGRRCAETDDDQIAIELSMRRDRVNRAVRADRLRLSHIKRDAPFNRRATGALGMAAVMRDHLRV